VAVGQVRVVLRIEPDDQADELLRRHAFARDVRDLAAVPRATYHRFKGRARKNQRVRALYRRFKRLRGG